MSIVFDVFDLRISIVSAPGDLIRKYLPLPSRIPPPPLLAVGLNVPRWNQDGKVVAPRHEIWLTSTFADKPEPSNLAAVWTTMIDLAEIWPEPSDTSRRQGCR